MERALATARLPEWLATFLNPLEEGNRSAGGRQSLQIPVIGFVGNLRPSRQVGHPAAQGQPPFLFFGLAFRPAVAAELLRTNHGRLHPQHAALFVIKLDRMATRNSIFLVCGLPRLKCR
jgi:hypothetical protein